MTFFHLHAGTCKEKYLCDVIIDTAYQHMGLGTALVSYIHFGGIPKAFPVQWDRGCALHPAVVNVVWSALNSEGYILY